MPHGITRRDFLRYSAAAAGSLWLASLAEWQPHTARAASPRQVVNPAPIFEALPLPTLLGPPTDVGIGTDGVYWVADAAGAPSTYDPVGQAWQVFGGAIDAVAYAPFLDSNNGPVISLCFFRGSEVYRMGDPGPVSIAQMWPNLPPSFQQGVDGAAYGSPGEFFLLRSGQIARVASYGEVVVFPAAPLGFPGIFDLVVSGQGDGAAMLISGDSVTVVNYSTNEVLSPAAPLASQFGGAALDLLKSGGLQAAIYAGSVLAADAPLQIFGGPLVYTLQSSQTTTPAAVSYLPHTFSGWPAAWHPALKQAPCGSSSALWSVSSAGMPLVNDTTGWTPSPLPDSAAALAVDSGSDGSVYAIAASTLYQMSASGWTPIPAAGLTLQAVAVGDATHIWLLDTSGSVYFYGGSGDSLTPVALGAPAGDIKGSADGTLWHCNAGDANAYRYISQGTLPSEAIPVGLGVTSVQKATASSFGAAFFLAQQNGQTTLVRYTSPYLFKTGNPYWSAGPQRVAVGGSTVFLFGESPISGGGFNFFVAALDVQTGAEHWRFQYPSNSNLYGYSPLYDPQHQLVYVFQDAGLVQALDAHSGALRWSLQLTPVIPVQPVLTDGVIYIAAYDNPNTTPNSSNVYVIAIDTNDAAQQAANNQPVAARWTFAYAVGGQPLSPLPPVIYNGTVYEAVWLQGGTAPHLSVLAVDARIGGGRELLVIDEFAAGSPFGPAVAPIVSSLLLPDATQAEPALVVNAGSGIYGFLLDGSGNFLQYTLAGFADNPTLTNLALFDGVIYFGDSSGNLYGLDTSFHVAPNLPLKVTSGFASGIVVMPDAEGKAVVIASDTSNYTLGFYSTATSNLATLATNQTKVTALSEVTSEGMLYAAGAGGGQTNSLGQVFGIRASDVSAQRDFVIESQMMQDYDTAPATAPNATGVTPIARYQTHITIVDDNKTSQSFTGVKIWCDDPITVLVDGRQFNIGPDMPVSTHVDASGCITVCSNAADVFASTLRVWAAFMDPFERIVVYPDQEFHTRLPAMVADPTNTDPTVINLSTGATYGGTLVFSDQQQAQATAQSVTSVCKAAGLGTGGSTAEAGRTAEPQTGPLPYIAYADLPGMRYFPYDTSAARLPSVQSPYGLTLDVSSGYSVQGYDDAAAAIDALTGEPDPSLTGELGSWFHHLWDKIKKGVAKVAKVVVSVAKVVYMGIQYVEDGVTHVLRQIVNDVEDLASLVGAFFVGLGKAIEDVIELLSLLLHFEQVVKTHNILKGLFTQQIGSLADTITNTVLPAVNQFFNNSETAIRSAFCTIKQQIVPGYTCGSPAPASSPPISGLSGSDATAHSTFTVAPKTGGSARSHAVVATWGLHKVRSHYQQASGGSATAPADNPILDFLSSFANRLTNDPNLTAAYTQTLNDFKATFTATSVTQFLQMALFDLLDGLEDMLISSLSITSALMDGLLTLAGDLVSFLFDGSSGILMQPLDIPILSDLYSLLFGGSQFTFFDLVLLVASIPVTFLYRVIEGTWFADEELSGVQAPPPPIRRGTGMLNAILFFGRSFLMPINDAISQGGQPNKILGYTMQSISGLFALSTLLKLAQVSDALFVGTALILIFPSYFGELAPAVSAFLALLRIGGFIFNMVTEAPPDALLVLSGNLLGSLPPLSQPLKYLNTVTEDLSLVLLVAIDTFANMGAGAVTFIQTIKTWDASPTAEPPVPEPGGPSKLYMPYAAAG